MKKIILLLITALSLSLPAAAQNEKSLFEFGVKAGLSLPSFFWLEDAGWNGVTMFAFQGAAWGYSEIKITDTLSIQAELGYNGKGASLDASDGSLKWFFNYIEVPVWFKWIFREPETDYWVGAGGYYGYFFGGLYDFDVANSEWIGSGKLTSGDSEIITEIRRHDFGLLFTAGYENGNFVYEFRFPFGLFPVLAFTPQDPSFGGYRKALNSGVMLCIGYSF